MEGLVTDCVNYLTVERGVSTNTTKAYVRDLNEYVHFLSARGIDSVDAVVEVDVVDYLVFLRRYLASSTVARKLSAIKTFHKFLVREGVTQNLPTADMGSPKTPKRLPGTLAVEEVRRLMEAPADAGPLGLRDRALLELLYGSGLRVSEAANLNSSPDMLETGFIKCFGKGSKERIVPVGSQARRALAEYLEKGRPVLARRSLSEALFLSRNGRRLARQRCWAIVKACAERAGLDGVHPHTLRHSYASHLIQAGADLRSVQELLGHENVSTTQVYTSLGRDDLRQIYLETHPRGPLSGRKRAKTPKT